MDLGCTSWRVCVSVLILMWGVAIVGCGFMGLVAWQFLVLDRFYGGVFVVFSVVLCVDFGFGCRQLVWFAGIWWFVFAAVNCGCWVWLCFLVVGGLIVC